MPIGCHANIKIKRINTDIVYKAILFSNVLEMLVISTQLIT